MPKSGTSSVAKRCPGHLDDNLRIDIERNLPRQALGRQSKGLSVEKLLFTCSSGTHMPLEEMIRDKFQCPFCSNMKLIVLIDFYSINPGDICVQMWFCM
jgi:hypothetical protein